MKNLKDMLEHVITPIELTNSKKFVNFLTEEADYIGTLINEADDDTADGNNTGGDLGGDADPFAAGGGDVDNPFTTGGDDAPNNAAPPDNNDPTTNDTDNSTAATDKNNKTNTELDLEGHADDPEWDEGTADTNDVTLSKTPAAKSRCDVVKVMSTVKTVFQTLSEEQLIESEKVSMDIELIFNGKVLNDEDLEFKNVKNAIFLIKKVGQKLNTKTRSYLYRKIKEPLEQKRDEIKQDIATMKGDLINTRDILTSLDTLNNTV